MVYTCSGAFGGSNCGVVNCAGEVDVERDDGGVFAVASGNCNLENIKILKGNGFDGELIARTTIEEQDIFQSVKELIDAGFSSVHWQLDANFWKHDYEKRDFKGFAEKSYNPSIKKLADFWVEEMRKGRVLKLYPFLDITEDLL